MAMIPTRLYLRTLSQTERSSALARITGAPSPWTMALFSTISTWPFEVSCCCAMLTDWRYRMGAGGVCERETWSVVASPVSRGQDGEDD